LVEEEKVATLTRVETTYKTEQEDYRQKLADTEKDNQKLKLEADKLKSELSDLKDK
jgi:regulator of replication initiation timing